MQLFINVCPFPLTQTYFSWKADFAATNTGDHSAKEATKYMKHLIEFHGKSYTYSYPKTISESFKYEEISLKMF